MNKKSLVVEKSKAEVLEEYTRCSEKQTDEEKAMWGSEESMLNRFHLGIRLVDWSSVKSWMDVGCGVGRFFALAEEENLKVEQLIGVDFTKSIISQARERKFLNHIEFRTCDLEALPPELGQVDLITLVGVLQLCGCSIDVALKSCLERIRSGGQLFLTTKHLGWSEFKKPGFEPDPTHSWFVMDDIKQVLDSLGINILRSGGFLPRSGKVVSLKAAHTLFIYGRKE